MEEIIVEGSLRSLPGEDVEIFGFGKSLLETPRSASTISYEQMERFNVSDIDELVAFAPGTFTQSFFGVAGSLDVRGTPGETYFRGVRRLDNPGNYPTPIGASDRIDIVRGPASPIYGPAKIGGYLNFNPKSARAESGDYLIETEGEVSYTGGSWDKQVFTAEVGGPMADNMGYYLYGEIEDSGSYYDNTDTKQTILQASFDLDVSDKLRFQFGGMYHDYEGNQVAGWNRLTQELVDDGTYITGSPSALDTDGDGYISHQEYFDVSINPFVFRPEFATEADLSAEMALVDPGTTTLSGNQVLVAEDDTLENEVTTLYFDTFYYLDSGWEIKNQLFYESYENLNENAYGFSQFHDTYVIEDKLVFSKAFETDSMVASIQLSPSIRYTDFKHGDDYTNEYFDRRDLTGPSTSLDARLLATTIDSDYTEYYVGDYLDLGLAGLADFSFNNGFTALIGLRYDEVDMESSTPDELLLSPTGEDASASDTFDGVSWTLSLSYDSPIGLVPYVTLSEQATVIAGQGAEIQVGNILSESAFDTSELEEIGIKGSFLDDSLYFAISAYEQVRTDFNAQAIVTNSADETKGLEAELRWVVNENLVLTAGYTNVEVVNLDTLENGGRFSFYGAEDLTQIDPTLIYGGAVIGIPEATSESDARKAGIPENIYTLTGTYDFNNGLAISASIIDADSVYSGYSQVVELPSYTLFNAGISYEMENWTFNLTAMNVLQTEEDFYQLAYQYFQRAAAQNLVYVEPFFDPQAHTGRGIDFGTVISGIHRAQIDASTHLGLESNLIMCFLRDMSAESAEEHLQMAEPYKHWIIGVGLDSDEKDNPPSKFDRVFARAREMGLKLTMHCDVNQKDILAHIDECFDLIKVDRIDHGINILEDDALCAEAVKRGMGFTVCPVSNRFVVQSLTGEEIKKMLSLGIKATINSDDPAYFRAYMNENLFALAEEAEFSKADILQLTKNACSLALFCFCIFTGVATAETDKPVYQVYLAGPEVFLPEPVAAGDQAKARIKELNALNEWPFTLEGLYPLDNEIPDFGHNYDTGIRIYDANIALMDQADFVAANMVRFRGPSMDVGTAFEMGYMRGLGKPVFGYYEAEPFYGDQESPGFYADRVHAFYEVSEDPGIDAYGQSIENFQMEDNLMMIGALVSGAESVAPDFDTVILQIAQYLLDKE
eukprot:g4430.t1